MTARFLIAVLLLVLASEVGARTYWIGREGLGIGKLGAAGSKGSNGTAPSCSNKLDFSVACNSQYLAVLH